MPFVNWLAHHREDGGGDVGELTWMAHSIKTRYQPAKCEEGQSVEPPDNERSSRRDLQPKWSTLQKERDSEPSERQALREEKKATRTLVTLDCIGEQTQIDKQTS